MGDDEAIATLSAPNSYASMRSIEPHGISISVIAQKTSFLPLAIVTMIVGLDAKQPLCCARQ
ncbi:MAG: hypothetical protein JWN24_699 [Phycisphaerales bacterium]|jgi:hypothetical protein|nr:hypothetical protein [Phycisphaerales bacterium]